MSDSLNKAIARDSLNVALPEKVTKLKRAAAALIEHLDYYHKESASVPDTHEYQNDVEDALVAFNTLLGEM